MYIQTLTSSFFRNYVSPLLENIPSNLDRADGSRTGDEHQEKIQNYSEESVASISQYRKTMHT
jgi:hypothetical protein